MCLQHRDVAGMKGIRMHASICVTLGLLQEGHRGPAATAMIPCATGGPAQSPSHTGAVNPHPSRPLPGAWWCTCCHYTCCGQGKENLTVALSHGTVLRHGITVIPPYVHVYCRRLPQLRWTSCARPMGTSAGRAARSSTAAAPSWTVRALCRTPTATRTTNGCAAARVSAADVPALLRASHGLQHVLRARAWELLLKGVYISRSQAFCAAHNMQCNL